MPKHKIILSTTEPNNNIPLIRIIQDDKNSQIFEAEIVEEGQLLDFDNKVVYFNAQIGPYKVRDKVESVDYANSRVSYTLIDAFQLSCASWYTQKHLGRKLLLGFTRVSRVLQEVQNFDCRDCG